MDDSARVNHYEALMEKIVEFRTGDKYCDVDIHVDERTFKGHVLILSAASKCFDRMFSSAEFGKSTEKVITIAQVKADVFEKVLRFVYKGDIAVINSSNVYDLMCAAHFFELSTLVEFCCRFVQENLDELTNDVLKIFSFAHKTAKENLVEQLSRHIHQHFHYFSKAPEFSELTVDQVEKVLDAFDRDGPEQPVLEDAFHEGIEEWIRRQVYSKWEDVSNLFRLRSKIYWKNLSVEYAIRHQKIVFKNQLSSWDVADVDASATGDDEIEALPNNLYAYISRRSKSRSSSSSSSSSTTTSIFSLQSTMAGVYMMAPRRLWISSGELEHAYDFLRTIVIGNRLFSLGYSKKHDEDAQQIFMTGASVTMYPHAYLEPPPLILDEFDMCGTGDYIYVYTKKTFACGTIKRCGDTSINQSQLSCGMYMYKRDADKWLLLPLPRMRYDDACMTCDEKLVYLIGGNDSKGYVQTYDVRTQGWSTLPPTTGVYESAACCVAGDKVYVAGGQRNPGNVEMYEPVSGKWRQIEVLPEMRDDKHQLVYFNRRSPVFQDDGIVSFSNRVSPRSRIEIYNNLGSEGNPTNWSALPHVLDFVKYKDQALTDRISILDMVSF